MGKATSATGVIHENFSTGCDSGTLCKSVVDGNPIHISGVWHNSGVGGINSAGVTKLVHGDSRFGLPTHRGSDCALFLVNLTSGEVAA